MARRIYKTERVMCAACGKSWTGTWERSSTIFRLCPHCGATNLFKKPHEEEEAQDEMP